MLALRRRPRLSGTVGNACESIPRPLTDCRARAWRRGAVTRRIIISPDKAEANVDENGDQVCSGGAAGFATAREVMHRAHADIDAGIRIDSPGELCVCIGWYSAHRPGFLRAALLRNS